jgi:hypothetical protein
VINKPNQQRRYGTPCDREGGKSHRSCAVFYVGSQSLGNFAECWGCECNQVVSLRYNLKTLVCIADIPLIQVGMRMFIPLVGASNPQKIYFCQTVWSCITSEHLRTWSGSLFKLQPRNNPQCMECPHFPLVVQTCRYRVVLESGNAGPTNTDSGANAPRKSSRSALRRIQIN